MIKKFFSWFFVLISLSGCHSGNDAKQIRVGTISGPETQLMQVAKTVLLKQSGLNLKIIEFSDYSLPNRALSDGSLDANMFQHRVFLEEEIKNKHYHLVPIAKLFIYPMGIYSKKIATLTAIQPNARVAIPNDPSNEARALLLLQQAGLFRLNPSARNLATPRDIIFNPKHLQIKELDAAQLTRSLPDVDCAVINTNYAVLANLYPQQDALFFETKNSEYANLLVVKEKDKNNPKLQALVKALQSPEVLSAAKQLFRNQAIPAWR
jgi:D-methionine transport system substrate-binding protein